MQTKDHWFLADKLADYMQRKGKIRSLYVFLFKLGCIEPDLNLVSYLKKSGNAKSFAGHNYENVITYINEETQVLVECKNWSIREFFLFGRVIHYIADAFTFPHNDIFTGDLIEHCNYEKELHVMFLNYAMEIEHIRSDDEHIETLHSVYAKERTVKARYKKEEYELERRGLKTDCRYIVQSTSDAVKRFFPKRA